MILDPTQGSHPSRITGEYRLVVAILGRAVLDLFGKVALTANESEADQVKKVALRFLTATGGKWAAQRADLCAEVGMCPDKMRRRVVAVLEGGDMQLFDDRHVLNDIDTARALWAQKSSDTKAAQAARLAQAEVVRLRREHEATIKVEHDAHDVSRDSLTALHDALGHGAVTRVVATLLNGPLTIRQIGFALDGSTESITIRKHLTTAKERGIVVKDGAEWRLLDLKECADAA